MSEHKTRTPKGRSDVIEFNEDNKAKIIRVAETLQGTSDDCRAGE